MVWSAYGLCPDNYSILYNGESIFWSQTLCSPYERPYTALPKNSAQHISSFRTTTPSPPSPHLLLIPLLSLYSFFSFIVPSIVFSKHETFSPPLLERGTPISLPALLLCVHPSQTKHYLTVVWVHKDKDGREREAERAIRLLKDREASTNGGIKKDRSVLQHRRIWEKWGGTRSTLYLCNIARSLSLSPRAGPAAETLRRLSLGSALPGLQTMKTDWSGGIQRAHSGPVTDTERWKCEANIDSPLTRESPRKNA